jgi:hypothetical protein
VQWERVSRFPRDSPTQVLDEVRLGAWIQVPRLDHQKMITVYHIMIVHVNGNAVFRVLRLGIKPSELFQERAG